MVTVQNLDTKKDTTNPKKLNTSSFDNVLVEDVILYPMGFVLHFSQKIIVFYKPTS